MAIQTITLESEALRRVLTNVTWWKASEYVAGLEDDVCSGDRAAVNTKLGLLNWALDDIDEISAVATGQALRLNFNSISFEDLLSGARSRMKEIETCMFEHDDAETRDRMYAEHQAAAAFVETFVAAEAVA